MVGKGGFGKVNAITKIDTGELMALKRMEKWCWGADAELVLFDGSIKKVQDIVDGDVLAGDDGTPRLVANCHTGHTADDHRMYMETRDDTSAHEATSQMAPPCMYQIVFHAAGHPSWTCNGDHVLVLQWNQPPSEVTEKRDAEGRLEYAYETIAIVGEGVTSRVEFVTSSFESRAAAAAAHAESMAAHEERGPLRWDGSVNQFLRCAPAVRASAQMRSAERVLFQPPVAPLATRIGEATADSKRTRDTAWAIGMWLASARAASPLELLNVGRVKQQPGEAHTHQEILDAVDRWALEFAGEQDAGQCAMHAGLLPLSQASMACMHIARCIRREGVRPSSCQSRNSQTAACSRLRGGAGNRFSRLVCLIVVVDARNSSRCHGLVVLGRHR